METGNRETVNHKFLYSNNNNCYFMYFILCHFRQNHKNKATGEVELLLMAWQILKGECVEIVIVIKYFNILFTFFVILFVYKFEVLRRSLDSDLVKNVPTPAPILTWINFTCYNLELLVHKSTVNFILAWVK